MNPSTFVTTMFLRQAFYFQYLTDRGKRNKINEILDREEGIAMANEVLHGLSKDHVERLRLISELKYQLDTQSALADAVDEGIEKGEKRILDMLKSGKSPEEIIREYENEKCTK